MLRLACILGLGIVLGVNGVAGADDDAPRLRDALALEETFQAAITKAEPSIACILVSRSDVYKRWFNDVSDDPCKLGDFFPGAQAINARGDDLLQLEELRKRKRQDNRFADEQIDLAIQRDLDLSEPNYVPESYGSGVVIHDSGLVLTNFHVIQGATKVFVRLPGGKGSYADLHAADARCDLAVLRLINRGLAPLPAIKIGDGSKLRKGQFVLSLANPFAAGMKDGSASASWGIIANLRRRAVPSAVTEKERAKIKLHQFETLIQTDARLNLGCSGGALINLRGEMVGLTTALAAVAGTESAGGYAIPMDEVNRAYVARLEKGLPVEYGFLGIRFNFGGSRPGGLGTRFEPIPGSSADRAGLHPGDVILSVNGKSIRDNDDLSLAISTCLAGSEARMEVRSNGGPARTITATLDKLYVPGTIYASQRPPAVRGLRVDFSSVYFQRKDPTDRENILRGVFVSDVQPGSPADLAGLQDKIIFKVNGKPVDGPADFYRTVSRIKGPIELTVKGVSNPVKLPD